METPLQMCWISGLLFMLVIGHGRAELLLQDPLLAGDWDDARCDRLAEDVAHADQNTVVDNPPKMAAKWVSEGCEVRPGPEFLLRSYTFHRNGTFRLLQFHYGEESCSLPLYTVAAKGRYRARGRSWLTPAATEAEYTLTRVTVTAQSAEVAEELAARVNATCPGQVRRRWRPYREYVVLSINEDGDDGGVQPPRNNLPPSEPHSPGQGRARSVRLMSTTDVDCLSALHAAFHELQLVRTQRRSQGPHPRHARPAPRAPRTTRHELLLGDVHSRPDQRGNYRPTAFQVPLLKADQAHGCDVCHAVARASERSPPNLHVRPRLPPYLGGDWVSSRCETRPLGLFLRRRLRVRAGSLGGWHAWQGEYEFFSDPLCTTPTLTATEAGRYTVGGPSSQVLGALQADFHVERAALTVLDANLLASLQADPLCGGGLGLGLGFREWRVGVARDLTAAHGCAPLGLVVPAIRYELVRVDVDTWGQSLLYLGQPDTENRRGGPAERPTAYQPPLVRCRGLPPPVPAMPPIEAMEEEEDANGVADDQDYLTSASARSRSAASHHVAAGLTVCLALLKRMSRV